jgi:uncharacterized protein (TIGR00251 family)
MAGRGRDNHNQLIDAPYSRAGDVHRLVVRVIPNAKRNLVVGVVAAGHGRSALSIRLAAPPVDGAANKALIAYLAQLLGTGRANVRMISGHTSRLKIVEIHGATSEAMARLLA